MKKFVIVVTSVALVASLFAGCGTNEDAQNTENPAVTESTVEDASVAGETTALTEAVVDTTAAEEIITEATVEETTAEVTVPEETTAATQESTTETTTYFVDNPNALPWG